MYTLKLLRKIGYCAKGHNAQFFKEWMCGIVVLFGKTFQSKVDQ